MALEPFILCILSCPALPRYQGHVPGVAFSFGSPYGTTTLKYFQDHRSAAMGQRHVGLSSGSSFPTIFSANPDLVLTDRSQFRDRWLHMPSYTRFNLDSHRSAELASFYQVSWGQAPPEQLFAFSESKGNLVIWLGGEAWNSARLTSPCPGAL